MGRKITYGTEKGGATGQKTVTRSIGDIYKEYYEQATSGVKTSNHPQIENVPSTSPFTAGLSSPAISRLSVFGSNLPSSLQESSTINKILSVLSQSPSKSLLQSVYPSGSKSSSQAARSPVLIKKPAAISIIPSIVKSLSKFILLKKPAAISIIPSIVKSISKFILIRKPAAISVTLLTINPI